MSNLAQGPINSNTSPLSEISSQNFASPTSEISSQNTSTHTYKNWPQEISMSENLANPVEKDVAADRNKDSKQKDNAYLPPFPTTLDLSNHQKTPNDSMNPSGNLELAIPDSVEPLLLSETLATHEPSAPLDEIQDPNLIDTHHTSSVPKITSLPVKSKIAESNQVEFKQPPNYLESIEKIHKQTQQTLKENDTKRDLEESHVGTKPKNTVNRKRQVIEVIQEHPTNIKQRPTIPENFPSELKKVNEKKEQRKLEGSENMLQESQNTEPIIMQKEDQANYTSIQIDSIIDPKVVQEDQSIDSTSVSIQSMEEHVENEDYNQHRVPQRQYPILPQAQIKTPKSVQSRNKPNSYIDLHRQEPFYDKIDATRHENIHKNNGNYEQFEPVKKETLVLTNKALSTEYEYELPYKNIEDVSLYPKSISTAGSNVNF